MDATTLWGMHNDSTADCLIALVIAPARQCLLAATDLQPSQRPLKKLTFTVTDDLERRGLPRRCPFYLVKNSPEKPHLCMSQQAMTALTTTSRKTSPLHKAREYFINFNELDTDCSQRRVVRSRFLSPLNVF
jgi:hypothetical protein